MAGKIDDFGEMIYGAKKHLAELGRALQSDDIAEWNAQEREQLITKDQIWKKPDYQQMYDDGMPREVVYFIKKIRDSLPVKPAKADEEYQKGYIDFVGYFRDRAMEMQSTDNVEQFFKKVVLASPYMENGVFCRATPEAYGCMTNKFFKAVQSSVLSIQHDIKKKEFLYSEDEKLLKGYSFFRYNGKNASADETHTGRDGNPAVAISNFSSTYYFYNQPEEFRNPEKWKPDTYIAVDRNSKIIGIDFPSVEDAKNFALEQEREKQKENPAPEQTRKKGKQRLTPPQLSHIHREGYDYRKGADAVQGNYLKELGFRGVQFGNWENQNDRQTNMNMAYDAMMDMAKALNISDNDVSLGNQLALAFGARGSGSAAAHYEPLENVINLTKMSGAGSLAHEWGHALDKFIQSNISNEEKIQKESEEKYGERASLFKEILLKKSASLRFATEDSYSIMHDVVQAMKYKTDENGRKTKTDYLKDAQKLDGAYATSGNQKGSTEKGYWSSDLELFARAFAVYVKDKMQEQGMRNDYLCGHAEVISGGKNGEPLYCYPRGEERKAINKAIDRVFEQLCERGLMHENTGISRTSEYIHTDFSIKGKKAVPEKPVQEQLPIQENTEKEPEKEKQPAEREYHEYTVGDIILMPSEVMTNKRMKPVIMPPEYAVITDITDDKVDLQTFKDSSLNYQTGFSSCDKNSFLKKSPEYMGHYEEPENSLKEIIEQLKETEKQKEPAVTVQSVQIMETTSDLLKQIKPDASPALVNAVIKELDRRIDAEKENVSRENAEDLFHYAKFRISYSVDGTEHSYESSQCEIGGYDRISLTEQVKFDVQYENGRLQRQPDSDKEQELKTIQKFLIPVLEQSEELNESDKKTLDNLFAEYDRQHIQQKEPAPEQQNHSVLDNAQKTKNGSLVVGNTQYRFIPKKTYISTDRETAEKVAEQLLANGTIKFSSAFRPNTDTATFTVNEQDKEILKQMIEKYRQNEKNTPDMPVSDNTAEHQNGQETENIQNSFETPEKQSRNTDKTPEKQLSFFDAVPEQEYQPEKPKQEVRLSFLDYIAARKTELDIYQSVAEICLDSIDTSMAVDEQRKELTEILVQRIDENLHSRESVITEQDLQECIEKNHVNTWLADFVNEVIEENALPEMNHQKKQQIQYGDF